MNPITRLFHIYQQVDSRDRVICNATTKKSIFHTSNLTAIFVKKIKMYLDHTCMSRKQNKHGIYYNMQINRKTNYRRLACK